MRELTLNGDAVLNDLLSFLALCPGGLCLSEVEIVVKKFANESNLTESRLTDYKKIFTLINS